MELYRQREVVSRDVWAYIHKGYLISPNSSNPTFYSEIRFDRRTDRVLNAVRGDPRDKQMP